MTPASAGITDDALTHRRTTNLPRLVWAPALAVILGTLVGIATVLFIYLLAFGYFVLSPEAAENIEVARSLGSGILPEIFFALGVLVTAFVAGYLGDSPAELIGLLCGSTAVATEQSIVWVGYPPVVPTELLGYAVAGTLFGLLGGWLGGKEAERSAVGEKALYDAMRKIGRATTSASVAEALGSLLGGTSPVGVGLWRSAPSVDVGEPEALWRSAHFEFFDPARLLAVADAATLPTDRPHAVRARALPEMKRREWEKQGVCSALVAPLLSSGDRSLGLLFVGFANGRSATRLAAAWQIRRRLLSAAAGAALALEKEDRGRRIGVMHERERVSRELHDTILQYLIAVGGELKTAELATLTGAGETASQHFERAHECVRLGTEEARRLMREMRPEVLDESPLPEAISTLVKRLEQSFDIKATCEVCNVVRPLAPEIEHALTRITQEALANVRKHSGASQAHVSLEFQPASVTLVISDDGVGLHGHPGNVRKEKGNFGIRSMRERADTIGGRLRIESPEGKGTIIVVEVATNGGGA